MQHLRINHLIPIWLFICIMLMTFVKNFIEMLPSVTYIEMRAVLYILFWWNQLNMFVPELKCYIGPKIREAEILIEITLCFDCLSSFEFNPAILQVYYTHLHYRVCYRWALLLMVVQSSCWEQATLVWL